MWVFDSYEYIFSKPQAQVKILKSQNIAKYNTPSNSE